MTQLQDSRTWRLPPTGSVKRTRPLLVNYFHMTALEKLPDHPEERLAQWDVLILHPHGANQAGISLEKIRQVHPGIVLLAWLPIQGPSDGDLGSGVPGEGPDSWYIRNTSGGYCSPPWGGHMMNPWVHNFAWPRQLIKYLDTCLAGGLYDGVMYDCLSETAHPDFDIDGDGRSGTDNDRACWNEGMNFLLEETRRKFPDTIITGNGGIPWPPAHSFYKWVDGAMHEYALGDGMDKPQWNCLWDGLENCRQGTAGRKMFHFAQVDLRMGRTTAEARVAPSLTSEDLRRMRLGLATTLMRDGAYFGFDRGDCLHGQLWWFDEYDADLGLPVQECRKDALGTGTLSRQFENGIVVVNVGTSAVKVQLAGSHKDVSTKVVAGDFNIPPQDGRIFSRI